MPSHPDSDFKPRLGQLHAPASLETAAGPAKPGFDNESRSAEALRLRAVDVGR